MKLFHYFSNEDGFSMMPYKQDVEDSQGVKIQGITYVLLT